MKYENRIVAFIDILGFSSIIKNTMDHSNSSSNENPPISVVELFKVFSRIRYLMGVSEPSDDVPLSRKVSQFSDSIFISFNPDDEPREFNYLLGELLYLHIELAKHNILIRGGISYGPLVHTDDIIFGPALVQAYQLESRAANSPRIILPQSVYEKDSEFNNLFLNKESEFQLEELLDLDEDDFYYLDYFKKCQNDKLGVFTTENEYIEHLICLRDIITKGLKMRDPGIFSKYGWMKSKWNATISYYKQSSNLDQLKNSGKADLYKYFNSVELISDSM
ncbi:MAG: hypothetical protein K9J30_00155 [Bacteroidales bacterium]|nr:hypothetical protein [Bacteroidales bacterium]